MNTFPTLSVGLDVSGFGDEPSDDAVQIASTASGYPVMNSLFTFDPRTFSGTLSNVSETDKRAVMTFYETNRDVPFYWLNEQDDTTYEVCFAQKPRPRLMGDDDKEQWQIALVLLQTAATTYSGDLANRYYGGDAMIEVENLLVGQDITLRPAWVAVDDITVNAVFLLSKGAPAGIDNSNTVVLTLKDDSGNTLLAKTYNAGAQPPTNDAEDLSSLLNSSYTELSAGDHLTLTVTQGTTANMPAFALSIGGYYR